MDNITHALVGVSLAECALRRGAEPSTRRVLMAVGVVAANAPDLDLLYTGITAGPLGYLLHHRGHSHTLPGLAAFGLLIVAAMWFWPAARTTIRADGSRVGGVIAAGLLSHLLLDAANSYGTLLLYPFSSQWYYGDAVFILEPAFWIALGVTVALNTQQRWSHRLVWGLTLAPCLALAAVALVTPAQLVLQLVASAALATALRRASPHVRAATGLAATVAIVVGLLAVSNVARTQALTHLRAAGGGTVLDVVLNAEPATPWCWTLLSLERDENGRDVSMRRGTLSLVPSLWPAETCASHRLLSPGSTSGESFPDRDLIWNRQWSLDLIELRGLQASDCRAEAWLRFGRVPFIDNGRLLDLRFDNPLRQNFSAIDIDRSGHCPSNVPPWLPPRSDLLRP